MSDEVLVRGVVIAIVGMSIAATFSKTFRSIIACIGGNLALLAVSMLFGCAGGALSNAIDEGNETIQFIAFIVTTFIAFVSFKEMNKND